jgi:hypothetical protein
VNCCWPLPAQSFLVLGPMTIFFGLNSMVMGPMGPETMFFKPLSLCSPVKGWVENTGSRSSSALVCILVTMEMCFNKLLHSNGCLCNVSVTPKFWLLGTKTQY